MQIWTTGRNMGTTYEAAEAAIGNSITYMGTFGGVTVSKLD